MKKETLIKVIDEEFGDTFEMSWLVDVFIRAFQKNDSRITEATKEYFERSSLVYTTLDELLTKLKIMEKQELKDGVRIMHKRNNFISDKNVNKLKAELKKERE